MLDHKPNDSCITVNCPPHGEIGLIYEAGQIDENILNHIVESWEIYWNQMYPAVIETMTGYEKPNLFGHSAFTILVFNRGGLINGDAMFELLFEDDPMGFSIAWVTTFKNDKLIHKQASF
jgi:hypothetical protein